jgi:hypothetical protein
MEERLLTLTFNPNEFCHCGHRKSEHRLDAVLLCAGDVECVCQIFEAEQMPAAEALPILVDHAGSCRSDSVSLAIMAVLRDNERMRTGLRSIASYWEGSEVTSQFDEPHAAMIAREVLG